MSARDPSEGTGASLRWLTHYVSGEQLVVVGWIECDEPGLAVAIMDEQWQLRATHFMRCPPPDGRLTPLLRLRNASLYSAHLRIMSEDARGLHAMIVLEQPGERRYDGDPANPEDEGKTLGAGMTDWFALEVDFAAEPGPRIHVGEKGLHHESPCSNVFSVAGGKRRYWLGLHKRLTEHWRRDDLFISLSWRTLQIARDHAGMPTAWRLLEGGEDALPVSMGRSPDGHGAAAQPYDSAHAVMLLHRGRHTCLCLIDLAGARITQALPLPIAARYWSVAAWTCLPGEGGGTFWLRTDNAKASARHRDSTLWRVDYGAAVPAELRKRGVLPIRLERLTEERAVTDSVVLDYADCTLALWDHGNGITHVDAMRCMFFRRGDDRAADLAVHLAEFADQLPRSPERPGEHGGRPVTLPSRPRLPHLGFDFAGRRLVVYEDAVDGYLLGEIVI